MKKEELEIQRGYLYTIVWYKMKFLYKKHSFKRRISHQHCSIEQNLFQEAIIRFLPHFLNNFFVTDVCHGNTVNGHRGCSKSLTPRVLLINSAEMHYFIVHQFGGSVYFLIVICIMHGYFSILSPPTSIYQGTGTRAHNLRDNVFLCTCTVFLHSRTNGR